MSLWRWGLSMLSLSWDAAWDSLVRHSALSSLYFVGMQCHVFSTALSGCLKYFVEREKKLGTATCVNILCSWLSDAYQ